MANRYKQIVNTGNTRFTQAPMGEIEYSTMYAKPKHVTDFDGGDIVPIYCEEVLPHDTFEVSLDYVIRQATVAVPTMDVLNVDYYAFFVPNRVVNKSWKNVMGENSSGAWAQPADVVLAPLVSAYADPASGVQVPVCSVADYYGYPTQGTLSNALLSQCHDLKFRGYLEIYNQYFRDQNYQPPIPYSKLNVYNGFFEPALSTIYLDGLDNVVPANSIADGSYADGAVINAIAGDGSSLTTNTTVGSRKTAWSALSRPLKANKLHDYFTSVLPSPQKSREVVIPLAGQVRINTAEHAYQFDSGYPLKLDDGTGTKSRFVVSGIRQGGANYPTEYTIFGLNDGTNDLLASTGGAKIVGSNLVGDVISGAMSIDDIRMSAAMQQVYEILGRGGSRYIEYINSFFGLDIDNPFDDIPTYLGHFRNELDLFQTAQTSASPSSSEGAGTAQGNLAAFGYTAKAGKLFTKTFNEHGYVHIMAVVRHKNIYSSYMARDNFRRSMMDFYQYPLANISEQPVYSREINPFLENIDDVFGYQEAWAEYRMSPDRVSGHMRPGVDLTLSYWTYADEFDRLLRFADGSFLLSNTADVVRRSTAVQDQELPQFKGEFVFTIKKQRPMPTYSVAGLDII